jgi:hypothetical protein
MENVEQAIATIKARGCELRVEGNKILSSRPLLSDEKAVLKENRAAAIAIINASVPETAEQAYQRGQKDGYAAGVRDTLEELKSRPPVVAVPAAPAPAPTTPDEEVVKFTMSMASRGDYWRWEAECLEALRAALVEGDRIQPLFAYTAIILHADGTETEFKRAPNRKK